VCSEGFKSLGTKNNVKIFVSATEGQRVHLTKGVTVVKATSETIKRCFIAPDNESFNHLFTVIDPMVSCTYVFMHWGVAREWILLGVHGFVRWRVIVGGRLCGTTHTTLLHPSRETCRRIARNKNQCMPERARVCVCVCVCVCVQKAG
jgi:hypothetical protein